MPSKRYHLKDMQTSGFLATLILTTAQNTKQNSQKNLEASLNQFGLVQIIKDPTRKTMTTSTLLDVMYIRTKQSTEAFVKPTSISDNYLSGCVRYVNYQKDPKTHFF